MQGNKPKKKKKIPVFSPQYQLKSLFFICLKWLNLQARHLELSRPNSRASPIAQQGKNLPTIQEIQEISIPVLGRSPGVRKNDPLQYSCLKNPMNRNAGQATVQLVTKTQTRLSN